MDIRDTYLAAWNETDAAARKDLLQSTWEPSATYVDPVVAVEGLDAISETIGSIHVQFPGFVFSPVGDVDTHHDVARFQWGLGLPEQEPVVVGFDVVATAGGRIRSVSGFLDVMPV